MEHVRGCFWCHDDEVLVAYRCPKGKGRSRSWGNDTPPETKMATEKLIFNRKYIWHLPSYVKANGSAFSSLLVITWCTWNDQGIFLALFFVWVSCDSNSETFHASFVIDCLLNHWIPGSSRCVEFLPLKVGAFLVNFGTHIHTAPVDPRIWHVQ